MEVKHKDAAERGQPRRRAAWMLGLAMAGSVNSASAGMPVIDYTAISQAIQGYISQAREYAQEAQRWKEVKNQIDRAMSIFDPSTYLLKRPAGARLEKIEPDYMVEETCGQGPAGWGAVLREVVFDLDGDLLAQQRQLCVNIRMVQNLQYNESVDFLEKTVAGMESSLWKIFEMRSRNNKEGTVQAANNEAARFSNEIQVAADEWAAQMEAYDRYVRVMQLNQNTLARIALKGSNKRSLANQLVQTAALKTALKK